MTYKFMENLDKINTFPSLSSVHSNCLRSEMVNRSTFQPFSLLLERGNASQKDGKHNLIF